MNRRLLALVSMLVVGAGMLVAKADGTAPLGTAQEATLSTASARTVYYLHGNAPVASADNVAEFASGAGGPYMDANAPTSLAPKAAMSTGGGNLNFRKNFLNAYWGGKVTGVVTGNPTASFWLDAAGALTVEVSLFGDGGIGAASPTARVRQNVTAAGPTKVDVTFQGLSATIKSEMVLNIAVHTASNQQFNGRILYDSTEFPSSFAFDLLPIGELPLLDDPAGIAYRAASLIAANAGTGHVVGIGSNGKPASILTSGFVHGGFTRGLTGLAVDGNDNLYASVADTGEIVFVTPTGASGVYARGLGTPQGIAFGSDGTLFVADASGKRVLSVSPARAVSVVATLPSSPYGIAVDPNGSLAVSTFGAAAPVGGAAVHTVDPATGATAVRMSLAATDSAEGLAFGESGALYIGSGRSGRLYRLPHGSTAVAIAAQNLGGPLNLAFSPAGTLTVASQGEGAATGDAITSLDVGEPGYAFARPSLSPTALPDMPRAWVHKAGGVALDPATFAGALPEAELRYTGEEGFEPTVGRQSAAAGGTLFTVAGEFDRAGGVLGSPEVLRSNDLGETWQSVQPRDLNGDEAPVITLDPYVWVDPATDRIFTFDLTAACQYLSYSDDDGDTWTSNPLACGLPPIDHQTLVGGKPRAHTTNGYPSILYHCSNHVAESPCGRSLDGGDTWQPAGIAYVANDVPDRALNPTQTTPEGRLAEAVSGAFCGGLHGHAIVDPDGRLFVPKGHCGRPYISISEDDGTTWTQVPVSRRLGSNDTQTTVASDSEGNLYYVFVGTDRQPYLSTSRDHGRTWSEPRNVGVPGLTDANIPSIEAGTPGKVAIMYMGTTTQYGYGARNVGKMAWNGYIVTTTDAFASDPVFTTTSVAPLTDPLIRGACGPGRCQGVFDFLDVIIDHDGRAWATFVDGCIDDCVANRSSASSESRGTVAPLLTGPNLRGSGSLAPLS